LNPIKKTFTLGTQQVTLETGEIARQAHGAVLCTVDDTVVLAAVTASKSPSPGRASSRSRSTTPRRPMPRQDPGGFFKREGRPTEKEILTSRLIDRPIRPLFPDGFYNEVQVVAQVLSLNPKWTPTSRR
jgi:polyribonucleotide nucleotidyltransferase